MKLRVSVLLRVLCFLVAETAFSLYEFDCPSYNVTGDTKATFGIAITCRIWVCPGQTVNATLCNTAFGDNYLRLTEKGMGQRAEDDDYWSVIRCVPCFLVNISRM